MNPVKRTGPNDCAFPLPGVFGGTGITAREWFAGMALVGLLAREYGPNFLRPRAPETVEAAYMYADAMLASPDKRKEE